MRYDRILFWKISVVWTNVSRVFVHHRAIKMGRVVSLRNAKIRAQIILPVPLKYARIFLLIMSNYIPDHELTKFPLRAIGNIRMHRECSAGITVRAMKAVRTMYREKPRYVHLNVKRTSIGKCYYAKNSARGFIQWGERALILSCILASREGLSKSPLCAVKLNYAAVNSG